MSDRISSLQSIEAGNDYSGDDCDSRIAGINTCQWKLASLLNPLPSTFVPGENSAPFELITIEYFKKLEPGRESKGQVLKNNIRISI
jgi:hypothetical protein